jgi:hypothetical protein
MQTCSNGIDSNSTPPTENHSMRSNSDFQKKLQQVTRFNSKNDFVKKNLELHGLKYLLLAKLYY